MVLTLSGLTNTLLYFMVIPSLPSIQRDLRTTQGVAVWVVTAFSLSASIGMPIIGRLGDLLGKRRALLATLAVLAVGTVLGAVATSASVLIIARALQGISAGVIPLGFALIRDEFSPTRVAAGIAYFNATFSIGAAIGVLTAGPIVAHLSTRGLFWIPAIFSSIALIAAALFLPPSPPRTAGRPDIRAVFAFAGWLTAVLLAISRGADWGWTSLPVLMLLGGGLVLALVWARLELRAPYPLVDLRMMRLPTVRWVNAAALLFGIGQLVAYIAIPSFVHTAPSNGYGFGAATGQAGLFLLPVLIFSIVSSLLFGRIVVRLGIKALVVGGSLINCGALGMLAVGHSQSWQFYVAAGSLGFGTGLAASGMSNVIVAAVRPAQTGVATGVNATIRTIGNAIGSQVAGATIAVGATGKVMPAERAYVASFVLGAMAFGLAALLLVAVQTHRGTRVAHQLPGFDNEMGASGIVEEGDVGKRISAHD